MAHGAPLFAGNSSSNRHRLLLTAAGPDGGVHGPPGQRLQELEGHHYAAGGPLQGNMRHCMLEERQRKECTAGCLSAGQSPCAFPNAACRLQCTNLCH